MNRCPNCAAQNREGAKFCTSCGFRLPAEQAPVVTNERSPFATTSTVPPHSETAPQMVVAPESAVEQGFATWSPEPAPPPAPGYSWDAAPPQNTAVPVDDEMIARLMEDTEPSNGSPSTPEPASSFAPYYEPTRETSAAPLTSAGDAATSVDHLLKLARELEYGLMELGDSPAALERVDSLLLANVLEDLQTEDELVPLRAAVATAQERPRDVDVMLDLVLRADAIAAVLTERDQLRSAVSLFLESTDNASEEAASADEDDPGVLEGEAEVVDESDIEIEDVPGYGDVDDSTADTTEPEVTDDRKESHSI